MKKWIVLLLTTCFLLGAALSLESVTRWFLPSVKVVLLKPSDIRQSIQCTGVIVVKGQQQVTLEVPVVVDEILVHEGDRVEKDQPLMTVNRSKTLRMLSEQEERPQELSVLLENPESIPTEVRAPGSGKILSIDVSEGGACLPGTALLTISSGNALQIEANISEESISDVRVGQTAIITGSGFKGREYGGTVSSVRSSAKQVNTSVGAITVVGTVITIHEPDSFLRPGYTATVQIITDTAENRLVVPYNTVSQDEDGREFMYIYSDGWVVRREIVTNRETRDGIEVVSGVRVGESAVVDPGRLSGHSRRVRLKGGER